MAGIQIDGVNNKIDFDDDADTSISSATDDTLVVEVGGNTLATVTATSVTFNDGVEITTADTSTNLTLKSTDASASAAPRMIFERDSASPADSDQLGLTMYFADNDAGESTNFFEIKALAVDVSDGTEDGQLRFSGMNGGSSVEYMRFDPGSAGTVFNDGSADIDFRVESDGLTHALFVDAGNDCIGIGTSSPSPFRFHVDSNSSNNGVAKFNHSDSTPEGIRIIYSAAAPDNTTTNFLECTDSSATRLQILGDGDIKNHDGTYGTISDERIKQNIVDANSQWDDIKNVRVRNYKKKDDVRQYGEDNAPVHIGLIAQELQSVSPGLVDENRPSFADVQSNSEFGTLYEDGDDIPDGKAVGDVKEEKEKVLGIKYSILYMKAIKALQEAMAKIETLETKVAALEGN